MAFLINMIGDSRLVFVEIFENSLKLNIFARDTRKTKSYQRAQLNPSSAIAQLGLGIARGLMHRVFSNAPTCTISQFGTQPLAPYDVVRGLATVCKTLQSETMGEEGFEPSKA